MKTFKKCLYLSSIFPNAYKYFIWKTCVAIINAAIGVANLYFLRYAINNVQTGGTFKESALILCLICVGNIISQSVISILNVKISAQQSYELQKVVKDKLFTKAITVDLSCYDDKEYYNKYTFTMSQCSAKIASLIDNTAGFVSSFITLIFSGVLSLIIDPLTLLFAFLPFLTLLIRNKRNKINHNANQKISNINRQKGYVLRVFYQDKYAKDMRTTNIHKPLLERFQSASGEIVEVYKTEGAKVAFIFIIESFLNKTLSEYLVLIYAAWKTIVAKTMQYGDCLVIVSTLQNIYDAINGILEATSLFHEHSLYADNLQEFLENSPVTKNAGKGKIAGYGDIKIENVSFQYPGTDKQVLSNINLHIKKGEKVAIVGHNGSGKSTLIKLLLRLYQPSEGSITLNGDNYEDLDLWSVRDMYSVVLQDYKHFSVTVKENVQLGIASDAETVQAALEKSGLMSRISIMDHGMDSLLDKEIDDCGEMLSGGEQQKLAISHVYLKNSDIIILDEPASALDPIAEHEMYQQMLNVSSGKTVLFISHRLSSAVMADRIIYLEKGRIIECGTHKELMQKNGTYADLFRVQAKDYIEDIL